MKPLVRQSGFSLVELMISMTLGLIITAAVIQVFVGTSVTNHLNQAISQVQESGRYISATLQNEFQEAGRYDVITDNIDDSVDLVIEAAFIEYKAIGLVGDFSSSSTLGSVEGEGSASDELVINLLADQDCTGNSYSYTNGELFHVVNHYYISNDSLMCAGYDGRVLRGLVSQSTTSTPIILLDNVSSFQLEYGITDTIQDSDGQVIQYITADEISTARASDQVVASIRFALLLKSRQVVKNDAGVTQRKLLNESAVTLDSNYYYQIFSHAIALRNGINMVSNI